MTHAENKPLEETIARMRDRTNVLTISNRPRVT